MASFNVPGPSGVSLMVNDTSGVGAGSPSDDALVRRAQEGSTGALDELVARHHGTAFRVALAILGDEADAADATQDGILRALRGLASFRGDASFRTWLLAIVANEARSTGRRRLRLREGPLGADLPARSRDVADGAILDIEVERARALLARLPEKQRLAVQLRVDEGLSFREVGAVIGSSEGSARVNYHHGIGRLREWMKE